MVRQRNVHQAPHLSQALCQTDIGTTGHWVPGRMVMDKDQADA